MTEFENWASDFFYQEIIKIAFDDLFYSIDNLCIYLLVDLIFNLNYCESVFLYT